MRFLLDENVPVQLLEALRCVLPAHGVDHVDTLGWKGKQDRFLFPDAAAAGYDALLTVDRRQLDDPTELRAIRSSGLHHITFPQAEGIAGLARTIAAVIAAVPGIAAELSSVDGQRLVRIRGLAKTRRHEMIDPRTKPPPYWR